MTRFRLIKLLDKLRQERATKDAAIERVKKDLSVDCEHERQEVYLWQHDDGYGRQTNRTGYRCQLCSKLDLWARQHWVRPEDCEW